MKPDRDPKPTRNPTGAGVGFHPRVRSRAGLGLFCGCGRGWIFFLYSTHCHLYVESCRAEPSCYEAEPARRAQAFSRSSSVCVCCKCMMQSPDARVRTTLTLPSNIYRKTQFSKGFPYILYVYKEMFRTAMFHHFYLCSNSSTMK